MKRSYEIILVFDAYQQEDHLNASLESIEKFIADNGGNIVGKNRWGKRRLAYEINKRQHGLYICLLVETENASLVKALETQLRLREEILRYLSIKMDQKMLKYPSPRSALNQSDTSEPAKKAETSSSMPATKTAAESKIPSETAAKEQIASGGEEVLQK